MKNNYSYSFKLFLVFFFFCTFSHTYAQDVYKNGIHKGVVKVKFSREMTSTLQNMEVSMRNDQLSTGITKFDAVAKNVKASDMERLFPQDPDPAFENKMRKHGLHLWYIVTISDEEDPQKAARSFKNLDIVDKAEVEYQKVLSPTSFKLADNITQRASTSMPFNDPQLPYQWHYKNTMWENGCDINLFEAWKLTAGRSDIIVSVHDEGIDVNHEDLKANIWINLAELNGTEGVDDDGNGYIDDIYGWNFDDGNGNITPQSHGTHVAGTIAAVNNNGIGVAGVAGGTGNGDGVKVMSLQMMEGIPGSFAKSYVYAAKMGAVISQNSWGYKLPDVYDETVLDAIDFFIAEAGNYPGSPMKGGIVIFAAGNDNHNGHWYPGRYESTLSVASLAPDWKKAIYSNYGHWVEVAAPGGDFSYAATGGVLSTLPYDRYGYNEGTSMACPHVSGIAALAIANSNGQTTNKALWTKLTTGVVNINQYNPDHKDSLGTGAIDAYLAIKRDAGIAPDKITDLQNSGITQESIVLKWTVPADKDDAQPDYFDLYYSTSALTSNNLEGANKINFRNEQKAGTSITYEIEDLLGQTKYYFGVISIDRWNNRSELSNVVDLTTNNGPKIDVDENSKEINFNINTSSSALASHKISLLNKDVGLMKWEYTVRTKEYSFAPTSTSVQYPSTPTMGSGKINIGKVKIKNSDIIRGNRSDNPITGGYVSKHIEYTEYGDASDIIGETDDRLPNSAAVKFIVNDDDGFNLTHMSFYLNEINPEKGPLILEIYEGSLEEKNRIKAIEYSIETEYRGIVTFGLDEQTFFPKGSTFWVALHIPAGNKRYPLGMGHELNPVYSTYCQMSHDFGKTWSPLEEVLYDVSYSWAVIFHSASAPLENYLSVNPESGTVAGNQKAEIELNADATSLINGTYEANLVLSSNDSENPEFRIPVNITVTGQKPKMVYPSVASFGDVFIGQEKTIRIAFENVGYGAINDLVASVENSQFALSEITSYSVPAKNETYIEVKFKPTAAGNVNGKLKLSNGTNNYEIMLFGVGAKTPELQFSPEQQTISTELGKSVTAKINVTNKGEYPLSYFVPGHDEKGISDNWPTSYNKYGYKLVTSYDKNPLPYAFQDISATGTDITRHYDVDANMYYTVDMGFDFPFYKETMRTLYVAQGGFTTFDPESNPINNPSLENDWAPKGYISVLGTNFSISQNPPAKIFVQVFEDKVIVQFNNVWDGWIEDVVATAQMVLYPNGNIRFYYKSIKEPEFDLSPYYILIEDMEKTDGIMIYDLDHPYLKLKDGLAIGLDYSGPNIIKSIKNGSGMIAPGETVSVEAVLSTESLYEGIVDRYINFISNDPDSVKYALVKLNVTGGTAGVEISDTEMKFETFTNVKTTRTFSVKNTGTSILNLSMAFEKNQFKLQETLPIKIAPKTSKTFTVEVPTSTVSELSDKLTITTEVGKHTISLSASIHPHPAISTDLAKLSDKLDIGTKKSHNLSVTNTGQYKLDFNPVGEEWLYFESSNKLPVTYNYETLKYSDGTSYNWVNISTAENKLPVYEQLGNVEQYWRKVDLGFDFEFYGKKYNSIKIGENGIISIGGNPKLMEMTTSFPTEEDGGFIAPIWGSLFSFNTYYYPDLAGLYCKKYDDKVIISWECMMNAFNMGNPLSVQVIIYKNGIIKFNYKIIGGVDEMVTNNGSIGIIKPDKSDYLLISDKNSIVHGKGAAFVILPSNKYEIGVNETLEGKITFDANNMLGGIYNKDLRMVTNVPGKELVGKNTELAVNGDAKIIIPESISLGNHEVLANGDNTHIIEMSIGNNGTKALTITKLGMEKKDQHLDALIYASAPGWFPGVNEYSWMSVERVFSDPSVVLPNLTIRPGETLILMAQFSPEKAGSFSDNLVVSTDAGNYKMSLTGSAFNPPSIVVDQTAIVESFDDFKESAGHSIAFNNKEGESDLVYDIMVQYHRYGNPSGTPQVLRNSNKEKMSYEAEASSVKAGSNNVEVRANNEDDYNCIIQYGKKLGTFIGVNPIYSFSGATKFNAGKEGINVSNVGVYFRSEQISSGVINVDVRIGGNGYIDEATILTSGVLAYDNENKNDEEGKWYDIKLDKEAAIYPNEDFYVVFTFPAGIGHPAGADITVENVAERYFYLGGSVWQDLQEDPDNFGATGYMMYAAEKTPKDLNWIEIVENGSGKLEVGKSAETKILISGKNANRGNQYANIVYKSNDTNNPAVEVPVALHINEGPIFADTPLDVFMSENSKQSAIINIEDVEGHEFTVEAVKTNNMLTYAYAKGVLVLNFDAKYGDKGVYEYVFRATDKLGATSEAIINLEVGKTNRTPVYVGEKVWNLNSSVLNDYNINKLIEDPDGDPFTFSITCSDEKVVNLYVNDSGFAIRAIKKGSVDLVITATDDSGATLKQTIRVHVDGGTSISDIELMNLNIYPNPTQGILNIKLDENWAGEKVNITIVDISGRICYWEERPLDTTMEINLNISDLPTGIYQLVLKATNKHASAKVIKE